MAELSSLLDCHTHQEWTPKYIEPDLSMFLLVLMHFNMYCRWTWRWSIWRSLKKAHAQWQVAPSPISLICHTLNVLCVVCCRCWVVRSGTSSRPHGLLIRPWVGWSDTDTTTELSYCVMRGDRCRHYIAHSYSWIFCWSAHKRSIWCSISFHRFAYNNTISQLPKWVRPFVQTYDKFGLIQRDLTQFFRNAEKQVHLYNFYSTVIFTWLLFQRSLEVWLSRNLLSGHRSCRVVKGSHLAVGGAGGQLSSERTHWERTGSL